MILNTRRRRLNITKILPGVLIFYASVYFLWPAVSARYRGANWPFIRRYVPSDDILSHTQNETLGFEHIYAIGLKERTDKRDFLTLASHAAGFKVEWIDGVRPDDLDPRSLPNGLNGTDLKPTALACWRAHMNALRMVLQNSYTTALILEDDADWDVAIKRQLREFARGVRQLNGEETAPKKDPYGTNWDILWIGGCASGPGANETTFFAIPEDPTVPSVDKRDGWGGPLDTWKEQYPNLPVESTRFLYRAEMGCCTYGYAVTREGAKKILAALSVDRLDCAVDNAMSDLCAGINGRRQLKCFATFPNLIGTYRHAGPASRDSDINGGDDTTFHEAEAWNMVYSTRLNIHRLVAGERKVYSQHKNSKTGNITELDLADVYYPRGILVG
ncbi:hypothetical protein ALT_9595 [Aspergillus lentulus]|uniref:Procollagen galactosyltransferase 1 n=1 Tax=Aspergillus lentulus TaxID=293939 RepID=A0AAN4TFM9_ASPLE|nr:uncharacterized protein IFM58399_05651 [Aspergillus lentulus]KAF4168543.1 hypothetical protein CNMCM6936_001857 [Aspergillus lentulus]KAF4175731.1 hypothetical protein CNMCM8060_007099 [Aspergillus lentulus]KAF4195160.1 hypothetical protein CNMCM8694_006591 [Aspergillus lentulus]GAQ12274.1 hypothetical protein ALT_9595 [Aspergillus lentulus]GFF39637.1 hypothetical protein IFM58399_05651 [Aspergillus lentulus]